MAGSQHRIPLVKPIFDEEMSEAAIQALQNERFVLGESVYKFEQEFARYCGTKFAISTASGTAALTLTLLAISASRSEVVTTPMSFVASANSIIHAGAIPKFADITIQTCTIDPRNVNQVLTERTKAVMPVHLYGYPAEMDELCMIALDHKLTVVEDACQAHGAVYDGKKIGSIGHAGCFSFYPSKNMTVGGDGGIVVTNDESIAGAVLSLRDCGRIKGNKYIHDVIGFTERMNTVQAAVGRVQLRHLDEWNRKRTEIARQYDELLSDLSDVVSTPPEGSSKIRPAYHMYVIKCQRRDDLLAWLEQRGVECGVHYPIPIHLQPAYQAMFGYKGNEFPNSERLCKEVLSLPIHPTLSREEVGVVSDRIHEFYNKKREQA